MTEERRAAPLPEEVTAAGPEAVSPAGGPDAAGSDTTDVSAIGSRDSSAGIRRRGRMALRIPDDEVSRPQNVAPEPMAGRDDLAPIAEAQPALVPTRIISITDPPPPVQARIVDEDDDGWRITPPPPAPPAELVDDELTPPPLPKTDATVEIAMISVETAEDERTQPVLPTAPSSPRGADEELEAEEVKFEDDAMTPALPRADPVEVPDRVSDPGDAPEVSIEDVMAVEAAPSRRPAHDLPPARPRLPSQPPAVPAPAKPRGSRPPLVIVPPHVGSVQPHVVESVGPRRKGRLWWEELFNDDYLRTMERLTEKQIGREADFIEESLGLERGGAILDLACGTGREAIELARRGYEVVGFDLSLAMLSRAGEDAQGRGTKLNFVQGDMREMTFEEQFDGVYCWNTSFGYFDEEKNAHVIDRVRHALKAGGLFLLDVVNRDFILRQSPSLAWFEGDSCVCMDEMNVDAITSRMKVKRTLMLDDGRSREIEYSMRVYSLHELGKLLHDHGFKVCEVSGRVATPGVFFGNESPRIVILAEKK